MPRPSARATDHAVTRAGRGEATWTRAASALPASRPATPPSSDRMADSARNWRRTSRRDAPSDLRIPISRVRSVTLISMMFMITIPPTTMPMPTTAGTTVKITRVSLPQNAIRPSPVSTVKSSSCEGRRWCAMRIASSARSMPSATRAAAGILTEITVVWRRPYSASNVVSGSMTNPSQDCPSTVPFLATTPVIVSCAPRTRIALPTARSGAPISFSATSKPSTATRRPGRERVVLHHDERRRDTEHEHVAHRAVAPLHVRHRGRPSGLERDGLRVGQRAFHVGGVLLADDGPALDPLQLFVVDEPDLDRVATDLKRVDPDDRARDALAHVRVHALDHRDHGHEEPDRHDDAEQREERAQLVAPRGLERLENRFGEGHGAGS